MLTSPFFRKSLLILLSLFCLVGFQKKAGLMESLNTASPMTTAAPGPFVGNPEGRDCLECHPAMGPTLSSSHHIHLGAYPRGVNIHCTVCHRSFKFGSPHQKPMQFADEKIFSETSVCDTCHSPGGLYDGVDDLLLGAKPNWSSGIYANNAVKEEKAEWCVTCHDDQPSIVSAISAPNIAGKSFGGDWETPIGIVSSNFSEAELLIDGNLTTGNTDSGNYIIFDLGQSADLSHLGLYTDSNSSACWIVSGSDDLADWSRLLYGQSVLFAGPVWQTGPVDGWNEIRLDLFLTVRYLKLERISPWPLGAGALTEFQIKRNLTYGYYATGHKIRCDSCHDMKWPHFDSISQTYRAHLNNYQAGYRLRTVEVDGNQVLPMEIPRIKDLNWGDYPRTSNDFALCFDCHDKYALLSDAYGSDGKAGTNDAFEDANIPTNFRNGDYFDPGDYIDPNFFVANEHLRHLRERYYGGMAYDWDSDWDSSRYPIIDNIYATTTGTWTGSVEGTGFYASNYILAEGTAASATSICRWDPWIVSGAIYNVYARWSAGPDRATNANYLIYSDYGTAIDQVIVNQTINSGQWVLLGQFTFSGAPNEYIELINTANGKVCADALKFERAAEVIQAKICDVDNNDATLTGEWTISTTPASYYGSDYLMAQGVTTTPTATCTWEPQLPTVGNYKVYAWWTAGSDRDPKAPFTISSKGGTLTTTVLMNQTINGGKWVLLGTFQFCAQGNEYVQLTNLGTKLIVADAVRFEEVLPINTVVDNAHATKTGDWVSTNTLPNKEINVLPYFNGCDYLITQESTESPTATCQWNISLPFKGLYQVMAIWTASATHATNAPYTISYQGGTQTETVYMNQTKNGGRWMLLGSYEFANTGNEFVQLSNQADNDVVADAIMLVKVNDTTPYDSPMSCTACHNVHGSPTPAMTRHGELASTPGTMDKAPMFNLQYLDPNFVPNRDLLDVSKSKGANTQFYGPGPGAAWKNSTCAMCHNDQISYRRTPVIVPPPTMP